MLNTRSWKPRKAGFVKTGQKFHDDPFVFPVVCPKQAVEVHVRQAAGEARQILLHQPMVEGVSYLG